MAHEHVEMTDPEMVDMLKRVTARAEAAEAEAKARDPQVCVRCLRLGLVIAQILWAETTVEDGADLPELHAALQLLYKVRDSYLTHTGPATVVQ